MDLVYSTIILCIGIVALYQYGCRLKAESDLETLSSELEQLLAAIEKSKPNDKFSIHIPRTYLARTIYREYLKIFLENRLNKRLNIARKSIHGSKPINHKDDVKN